MTSTATNNPYSEKGVRSRPLPEIWLLPALASVSSLSQLNSLFGIQPWIILMFFVFLRLFNMEVHAPKGLNTSIVLAVTVLASLLFTSFGYHLAKNGEIRDIRSLITLLGILLVLVFCAKLKNEVHLEGLLQGCVFAFYLQLILGCFELVTDIRLDQDSESYRFLLSRNVSVGYSTTLGNPNDYIYFLLIGLVLSQELIWKRTSHRWKLIFLHFGIFLITLFFILANDSRGGLLCFTFVVLRFLYLLSMYKQIPIFAFIIKSVVVIFTIFLIAIGVIFVQSVGRREYSTFLESLGFTYGDYERSLWIVNSLILFDDLPIFGLGPGNSFSLAQNLGLSRSDLHFSFFQIAFDYGILAAIVFLVVLAIINVKPRQSIESISLSSNYSMRSIVTMITFILVAWSVGTSGALYQPTFWILLATTASIAVQLHSPSSFTGSFKE